ncbi:hypothetical protein N7462_006966 [Penicillium macrosclerotiorum]|uniref:uncharacterized protein n=1 Tax=Penicillium macrosclerotiorum TaxID=303699 RepID=UPI002548E2BC|nr:uncharacterized protein N7462_006966 [Penicillium macrosclerotiorum]KAJ5678722.1 hypothetical protein N7462_006966 [Penicillium macrosclerotiorum]
MLDPLGPPPAWLQDFIKPYALKFNSPTLTEHIHEVIGAFIFYQFIHSVISPWLSPILFPRSYPALSARTKLNWDIHVVSLIQSVLINVLALWVMFVDKERSSMSSGERVFGYTGGCGLIQALAVGYFIYDLIVSAVHLQMFGIGMLFHAVSALWVFSLGFRPFLNYYAPVFILYELSSPFLNIHWFLDKVNMTGSRAQWYNGMALLSVFFCCRLVWGTWQTVVVYRDMWFALQQTWSASSSPLQGPVDISANVFQIRDGGMCIDEACARANAEIALFKDHTAAGVPTWLIATYVASNLILNFLNYFWFSKMVETVLKRFRGPAAGSGASDKKTDEKAENLEEIAQEIILEAAAKLEQEESAVLRGELPLTSEQISSAIDGNIGEELRRRRAELISKVPLPSA